MSLDAPNSPLPAADVDWPLPPSWRLRDVERGVRNLNHIAAAIGPEGLRELSRPLGRFLPRTPDPDMALNNFERFLNNPTAVPLLPTLLENRGRILEVLLRLLGTSHFFSDLLALNPDYLDMLRLPLRRSPDPAEMREQLQAEVDAAFEDSAILRLFRRFRQRQLLRIGTNDIIRERPLEEITRDISRVAEVSLEVALATAVRTVSRRFGQPTAANGQAVQCVVLAFGKLGGEELNYSSDIDLMFLYDEEGTTQGKHINNVSNDDYFSAWSARWYGCFRRTRTAVRLIGSICGCGLKVGAARLPGRSPALWRTTIRLAEPGNARPSSSSAPSPATSISAGGFFKPWSRLSIASI